MVGEMLSIESIKSEVACLYYLQLSDEKRSKGMLIIQFFIFYENVVSFLTAFKIIKITLLIAIIVFVSTKFVICVSQGGTKR